MASNIFEELLSQVPVAEIAQKFGIDEDTATAAVKQALPGLVGGMAVNANSEEGQQKLAGALGKHTPAGGKISLDAIDAEDGKKIVKHVLGDQEDAVAQQLGAQGGGGLAKFIPMLLPLLAPIVMQFLAGRVGGGAAAPAQADEQGGGLGDLLGGLLGGMGGGSAQSTQGAGGLGDILGGLLGGGSNKGQGGITDLLGGLLGR